MDTNLPENTTFLDTIWDYKYFLAFYTIAISFVSFGVLYFFGAVPSELRVLETKNISSVVVPVSTIVMPTSTPSKKPAVVSANVVLPKRILIEKIGVDSQISNTNSTDINTLNNLLLSGAVRYPGSGTLGQGNMFVFGHSTGIRIVNNQAYKAFNHLNQLVLGDVIKVRSENKEYVYKVVSVSLVDSNEELVDFTKNKNMLTLSTCDVFGKKQERFVVEALFDKSYFF